MPDLGGDKPAAETKATTELPEWAKPYAKDILAKGQALTDVNQNPYQTYNQDRVAGFSPMQQQAMQNAQGMSVTPQTRDATAGATMAGLGGMNVAGQANQYGFQNQMGGYMNPYMNQILAPQMAEANRQYDIGATKQQSAATQAGAFGGSREAIMAAENERNRNTGLNQIYGQGMNTAYNQAQNQYNQNLQSQLAGYGLMNQSATNLGQLGQNQYGQQMGINQLQNQYGTAQQNLQQTGLNNAYQDFQNQQNYPYKQLGFMSDMIRGLPLGQQSTSQMYQGAPTALQGASALGMGAYGYNQMMKADGGSVHGYADGGEIKYYAGDQGSVTSDGNIQEIINKLSPQQLQQAKQTALARRDIQTVEAIDQRLAELSADKSMTQGIAGAMPEQMADGVVNAAGGGILAFQDRGLVDGSEAQEQIMPGLEYGGDDSIYRQALKKSLAYDENIGKFAPVKLTAAEKNAAITGRYNLEKSLAGPDTAGTKYSSLIDEAEADRPKALSQGRGLAALRAMRGMVQGNNFIRGIGNAGAEFAEGYSPFLQADRKEKLALGNMQFNLADAQRKERMGMTKSAIAAAAEATKDQQVADKFALDKLIAQQRGAQGTATAARPIRGAGSGSAKAVKINEQLGAAEIAHELNPTDAKLLKTVTALRRTADRIRTSDIGPGKDANEDAKLGLASEAKAADAWGNMSGPSKKSFAAAQGFDTSRDPKTGKFVDPEWEERARKAHVKSFKTPGGGANATPALPPGFNPVR